MTASSISAPTLLSRLPETPVNSAANGLAYLIDLTAERPTGELVIYPEGGRPPWRFYLYAGRLTYATGGPHPMRLWQRWLSCYGRSAQIDMSRDSWEVEFINRALQLGAVSLQEAKAIIHRVLCEAIFYLIDCPVRQVQFYPHRTVAQPTVFSSVETLVQQAQQEYHRCSLLTAGSRQLPLPRELPYLSATVIDERELRSHLSPERYQRLCSWLHSGATLGDVAAQTRQSFSTVVQWLAPFIHGGWIDLIPAGDLPNPAQLPSLAATVSSCPVAWVDSSPLTLRLMREPLAALGYRLLPISQPIEQISLLLEQQPAVIVINAQLDRISGYQFCRLLRRMDAFDQTPILLGVDRDSPVATMRARLAGANQTLVKPFAPRVVGQQLTKYVSLKAMP